MAKTNNVVLTISLLLAGAVAVVGDEPTEPAATDKPSTERLVKLSKDHNVWIDMQRKLVVVDGRVAMREGALEMFACPKGTKEHEAVVAVDSTAQLVHAGLLAVGAKPGHPVKFNPKYVAAAGTKVDILVLWQDDEGKHKVRAQQWVKNAETGKEMTHDWVFGGSGFWKDERTGEQYYSADGGDLICVSNFSTATLDLPIESSQANGGLLFSAFSDRIPPRDTKVRLVLIPRHDKKKPEGNAPPAAKAASESAVQLVEEKKAEVPE